MLGLKKSNFELSRVLNFSGKGDRGIRTDSGDRDEGRGVKKIRKKLRTQRFYCTKTHFSVVHTAYTDRVFSVFTLLASHLIHFPTVNRDNNEPTQARSKAGAGVQSWPCL